MMAPQSKMGMKTASANLFLQVNGMDLENLICFDKGKQVFYKLIAKGVECKSIVHPNTKRFEYRDSIWEPCIGCALSFGNSIHSVISVSSG